MWQHVQLSEQNRPWYILAGCWDVQQPPKKQTCLVESQWFSRLNKLMIIHSMSAGKVHVFNGLAVREAEVFLCCWTPWQQTKCISGSTKTECGYLYGWTKKRSHMQRSHQRWWTLEIQLGTQKKKISGTDLLRSLCAATLKQRLQIKLALSLPETACWLQDNLL